MFFKVPELFKLRRQTPQVTEKFILPYNLKPSAWSELRTFHSSDAHTHFVRLLDEVVKLQGELLLGAKGDENLHYYRGMIRGLRQAATLIDEIYAAETLHTEQDRKRKDAHGTSERSRTNATFGTPAWRSNAHTSAGDPGSPTGT